jgi:hypothetical protein
MIEVTEFEPKTHWRRNRLWTQDNGSYSEQSVADTKSFVTHETWASLRNDGPGIPPSPNEMRETGQVFPHDGLLAGTDRWGFVYGLSERPISIGNVINVETPLDHWFWCADPALTPRICLKKRMSILSHFDE